MSLRPFGPMALVTASALPLLLVIALAAGGCRQVSKIVDPLLPQVPGSPDARTGYESRLTPVRSQFKAGNHAAAIDTLDRLIDDPDLARDVHLLHLERASLHAANGDFAQASRDLEEADRHIEVLDFTMETGELERHLFSEDGVTYRAKPHEKFFVPTLNLLSYAAQGRLREARTEASLLYSRLDDYERLENDANYSAFSSPAAYLLIGLLDHMEGDSRKAAIAFERAGPLIDRMGLQPGSFEPGEGKVLVFVLNGRAPGWTQRLEELHSKDREHINGSIDRIVDLVAAIEQKDRAAVREKLLSNQRLRMAVLERGGQGHAGGTVQAASTAIQLESILDLEAQTLDWYDQVRPQILDAALLRLATRAAVKSAVVAQAADHGEGTKYLHRFEDFVDGAISDQDTPDTRCWSFLPRNILFQVVSLPAGEHRLDVKLEGDVSSSLERTVSVAAGEYRFLVLHAQAAP